MSEFKLTEIEDRYLERIKNETNGRLVATRSGNQYVAQGTSGKFPLISPKIIAGLEKRRLLCTYWDDDLNRDVAEVHDSKLAEKRRRERMWKDAYAGARS